MTVDRMPARRSPALRTRPSSSLRPAGSTPRVALAIATGLGAGFAPFAPGTWGALLGIGVFLGLAALPWWLWLASGLGLCALGVWSSTLAEEWFAREDDARIVIDEVAGQVIALAPLLFFRPASLFSGLVTGFVAFRLFDIWKPGPVRWAERGFRGGVGVMADDIVAGIMAASILVVLGALGLLEWFDAFASGGFVESQEVQPL